MSGQQALACTLRLGPSKLLVAAFATELAASLLCIQLLLGSAAFTALALVPLAALAIRELRRTAVRCAPDAVVELWLYADARVRLQRRCGVWGETALRRGWRLGSVCALELGQTRAERSYELLARDALVAGEYRALCVLLSRLPQDPSGEGR